MRARPAMAGRYTGVAIALHWLIAALIVANLYLGWRMGSEKGMAQFATFQLHKSIGISVLMLSLFRLAWRVSHRPPPYPRVQAAWERMAASVVQITFYIMMIAMPLTGWVIVSASPLNIPTLLFNTVPLPHIAVVHDLSMPVRRAVAENIGGLHEWLALGFAALIALHVAAALRHQFLGGHAEFLRMLPTKRQTEA